ncbi:MULTISPECIES: mannose-6-phosphate isomerase, class I [unclassified Saccharothrix]|uniref:mannose-6-phosphate isomerase, class I n=1 Tax=unclassified Saccharothrix TaxID=2593673 RepID=UPI00307E3C48
MHVLDTVIRDYHWGSRTALAALRGEAPTPHPEAELWIGAHPASPSTLRGSTTPLHRYLAANPAGLLGSSTLAAFGPRLPFLLKVLAVEQPLSLQVHPDRERARTGHAQGFFGDDRPKPEILVALTDFETLSGFREPAETLALLDDPALAPLRDHVAAGNLHQALHWALHSKVELTAPPPHLASAAAIYPNDPGLVAALLLNHVKLRPGQGIYVAAGVPHAHLHGTGVELMADSDNVVRAGLTTKPVDATAVLDLVDATPAPPHIVDGTPEGPITTYATPEPEFRLHSVTPGAVLHGEGPQLLLCTKGTLTLTHTATVTLHSGEAAFLPHGHKTDVSGDGEAFWATTGAAA